MNGLIESTRTAALHDGWTGRAASFALHSAAVTVALLATRPAPVAPPLDRGPTTMIWSVPRPTQPPPALPGAPVIGPHSFVVPAPPLVISTELPPALPVIGQVVEPLPGIVTEPLFPQPGPVVTGVLEVRYVEELPVLVRHPALRYPELLRQAGVEADLLVEAVIDTVGAVERGSLRLLRRGHALFEAEALALVAGSRYRPARANGRAVRVRVQVPVRFALRR